MNYSPSAEDEGNYDKGGKDAASSSSERELQTHLVTVNVSPITYGHSLIIPQPEACLPQVFTQVYVWYIRYGRGGAGWQVLYVWGCLHAGGKVGLGNKCYAFLFQNRSFINQ